MSSIDLVHWGGRDRIANIEQQLSTLQNGGSLTAIGDVSIESDTDVSGVGDLILKSGGVERARIGATGTITGLAAAATTPTNSELLASTYWPTAMTVTTSLGIFTLPFAADIKAASVVMMNAGVTADDTNYWTVEIMSWRNTDGVATVLATKNTKITGGAVIVQRADWNFDAVTFANNLAVAKGYTIGMRFTPSGAPSSFNGALMTVRYEPT